MSKRNSTDYTLRPLTQLATQARDAGCPRVICGNCMGFGSGPGFAVVTCPYCRENVRGACPTHVCKTCDGKGVACPRCLGARFLSSGQAGHMNEGSEYQYMAHEDRKKSAANSVYNSGVHRCEMCCEGNQVDYVAEMKAIMAYLKAPHEGEWARREQAATAQEEREAASREKSKIEHAIRLTQEKFASRMTEDRLLLERNLKERIINRAEAELQAKRDLIATLKLFTRQLENEVEEAA